MEKDEKQLIFALEKVNLEYIQLKHSKEYLMGKRIYTFTNLIKNFKFIQVFKKIYNLKKIRKFLEFKNTENTKSEEKSNIEIDSNIKNKVVIYSCITGKYDDIQKPFIKEKNVKYILFTDNKNLKSKDWEIRNIPSNVPNFKDSVLINRYIKMHPKKLFPEYDYSYYIDGNIRIMSEVTSLINKVDNKTGLALHKHKARKCTYDEIDACIIMKRGNVKKLQETKKIFMDQKFPSNYGLFECNLIITDLNNNTAVNILNSWWNEFYKSKSYRDQIYFPYTLWKNNILASEIGIIGNNIYTNPKFRICDHK